MCLHPAYFFYFLFFYLSRRLSSHLQWVTSVYGRRGKVSTLRTLHSSNMRRMRNVFIELTSLFSFFCASHYGFFSLVLPLPFLPLSSFPLSPLPISWFWSARHAVNLAFYMRSLSLCAVAFIVVFIVVIAAAFVVKKFLVIVAVVVVVDFFKLFSPFFALKSFGN